MADDLIAFIRRKDYQRKKTLGRGACGETVLLFDPQIDQEYVCKKYSPYDDAYRVPLFQNFVREIKLLHALHHRNVVRVYNSYLYPDKHAGYILMEYVQGATIDEFLARHPDAMSDVFEQAIEGFAHLEANNILHRDIRYANVLITDEGVLKIIDLGFGKRVIASADFDKSISVNLWCAPPAEFAKGTYDFCTEVYFVGMLFQQIIQEMRLSEFKYPRTLGKMCQFNPDLRIKSFAEVRKDLLSGRLQEVDFDESERVAYREFSASVCAAFAEIAPEAKYVDDVDVIQGKLEVYFRSVMLEEIIPDVSVVLSMLVSGPYSFYSNRSFAVDILKAFINLLKGCSPERKSIILANLHTKLDAVARTKPESEEKSDNDIPF